MHPIVKMGSPGAYGPAASHLLLLEDFTLSSLPKAVALMERFSAGKKNESDTEDGLPAGVQTEGRAVLRERLEHLGGDTRDPGDRADAA